MFLAVLTALAIVATIIVIAATLAPPSLPQGLAGFSTEGAAILGP
ncbi:hypothetical protein ACQXVK_09375 [Curtobacterium sp. AB451]|nr:hypothetical protein [Curtobacterium sp. B18]